MVLAWALGLVLAKFTTLADDFFIILGEPSILLDVELMSGVYAFG